jgi:hypothetical protein
MTMAATLVTICDGPSDDRKLANVNYLALLRHLEQTHDHGVGSIARQLSRLGNRLDKRHAQAERLAACGAPTSTEAA